MQAISLVLSEAVYKQLDEGGADRATVAVSELLQQYPAHLGLRLMGIRWEQSEIRIPVRTWPTLKKFSRPAAGHQMGWVH